MRLSGIIAEKGLHAFDSEERVHAGHAISRLWVIVADQEKARFWRKTESGFHEIGQAEEHVRHPVHSHKYGHQETHFEAAFAEKLSDLLETALDENVFDRIILIASPRMMGAFHEILPNNVRACIAAEIPKDFMHFGQKELEKALEKIIVI
jgi:protein required for attachment to host cells